MKAIYSTPTQSESYLVVAAVDFLCSVAAHELAAKAHRHLVQGHMGWRECRCGASERINEVLPGVTAWAGQRQLAAWQTKHKQQQLQRNSVAVVRDRGHRLPSAVPLPGYSKRQVQSQLIWRPLCTHYSREEVLDYAARRAVHINRPVCYSRLLVITARPAATSHSAHTARTHLS